GNGARGAIGHGFVRRRSAVVVVIGLVHWSLPWWLRLSAVARRPSTLRITQPSAVAGHRHPPHQDGPGPQVRAGIDVAAHGLDAGEHLLQVAGDGEAVDRVADAAILDPEPGRPSRVVT